MPKSPQGVDTSELNTEELFQFLSILYQEMVSKFPANKINKNPGVVKFYSFDKLFDARIAVQQTYDLRLFSQLKELVARHLKPATDPNQLICLSWDRVQNHIEYVPLDETKGLLDSEKKVDFKVLPVVVVTTKPVEDFGHELVKSISLTPDRVHDHKSMISRIFASDLSISLFKKIGLVPIIKVTHQEKEIVDFVREKRQTCIEHFAKFETKK